MVASTRNGAKARPQETAKRRRATGKRKSRSVLEDLSSNSKSLLSRNTGTRGKRGLVEQTEPKAGRPRRTSAPTRKLSVAAASPSNSSAALAGGDARRLKEYGASAPQLKERATTREARLRRRSQLKITTQRATEEKLARCSRSHPVLPISKAIEVASRGAAGGTKKKSEWSIMTEANEANRYTDFLGEDNHNLVRNPMDATKYVLDIADHDTEHRTWEDPLRVSDYVADIFQRLYHSETLLRVTPNMVNQSEVTVSMRYILVDWLVEVHTKFDLRSETFHLAVQLIDRYLEKVNVRRKFFQLLGVSSMLVAAKYQETYPPTVRDCVYITDGCYTRQEVIDMETEILETLNFELSYPTAFPFCQRFLYLARASKSRKQLANYYLEFTILDKEFLDFRPSVVASAAVCLALNQQRSRRSSESSGGFPNVLLAYTGFSKAKIRDVAQLICDKLARDAVTLGNRKLRALHRKYSLPKYGRVAGTFDRPKMGGLLQLE